MDETLAAMFERAAELLEADHEFDALELIHEIWMKAAPASDVFARTTRILTLVGMDHVASLMPGEPNANEREYWKALERYRQIFDASFEVANWPRPGLN
jgi:hypothetical protein